jgi:hypothetical protein
LHLLTSAVLRTRRTYNSPDTVWYKASDKLDQYFHTFFTSHVEHY